MKIYLSGKMAGLSDYGFSLFDEAKARAESLGHIVESPADVTRRYFKVNKASDIMGLNPEDLITIKRLDLIAIRDCEAIALLPNWVDSPGAKVELEIAKWLGLQIFDSKDFKPYVFSKEIRTTCESTGGQKGVKPERFSLIPTRPLAELARVYGYGANKYASWNWSKGYEWSKTLDALGRHINAFQGGEDIDPESGLNHMAHAIFHCMSLIEWGFTHPELDDRNKAQHS